MLKPVTKVQIETQAQRLEACQEEVLTQERLGHVNEFSPKLHGEGEGGNGKVVPRVRTVLKNC